MFVQFRSDVDRSGLDGGEEHLCVVWALSMCQNGEKELHTGNTRLLDVYEVWLKHAFRCLEPLLADLNDTTIR